MAAAAPSAFAGLSFGSWSIAVLRRLAGALCLALGAYAVVSIVGFEPGDPTINLVDSAAVANPGGRIGANVADLALQTFGYAFLLAPAALMLWGWRLMAGRRLRFPWLPPLALPLALLVAAAFLAQFTPPERAHWPFKVGLGGFVGDFQLVLLRPSMGAPAFAWLTGLLALVLATPALGFSLRKAANGIVALSQIVGRWTIRRLQQDDEAEPSRWERAAPLVILGRIITWLGGRAVEPEPGPGMRPRAPRAARRPPVEDDTAEDAEHVGPLFAQTGETSAASRSVRSAVKAGGLLEEAFGGADGAESFDLPALTLLAEPPARPSITLNRALLEETARQLESVLDDFGVRGQISDVKPGPVVTLFELEPAPGTRAQRVISLADDIARSLCAYSVRVATIPGRNVIGIELPNERRATVFLRDLLESGLFQDSQARLALALGKDIAGNPIVVDLARMPHLLIAGTTGSGKSVAINAMILSLLYRLRPEQCRIIMIDPKVIELSVYEDIPHLLSPVVTEPHKAIVALKWVVRQMDERYRLMSHLGVRDILAFNKRLMQAAARGEQLTRRVRTGFEPGSGAPIIEEQPIDMTPLPLIVVIVDEVADLMLTAGKEIEHCIQRLSQKARAAGVHLIVATQRPSVDVLTGVIKANLPSRISFRVSSKIDSRTVLGEPGAEQLLGQGDMLYMMPGDRITRVHGALVTDSEVERVVSHLKRQGRPDYVDDVTSEGGEADESDQLALPGEVGGGDAMYEQAIQVVARDGKASTSYLQRKLSIGYNSAAKLIERMEQDGLISGADHVGRRRVLMGRGGVDGDDLTDAAA